MISSQKYLLEGYQQTVLVIYLTLLIILVIVSGFFSGSETAITAVSKARIYTKIKQGNKKAKYVDPLKTYRGLKFGIFLI